MIPFFGKCALTKELSLEEREIFSCVLKPLKVKAQTVIFWEESPGEKMYFVQSGSVVVSKKVKGNVEKVIARFKPGDFFGELSLVDESPRSATVQTESDAQLLILDKKGILQLENKHPQISSRFYRAMLRELSHRLRQTTVSLRETVLWGMEASSIGEKDLS